MRTAERWLALGLVLQLTAACGKRETDTTVSPTPAAPSVTVAASPAVIAASPVPAEYSALYRSLSDELDGWQRQLNALSPAGGQPVFGAHVLAANSNRGTALLNPATMPVVDTSLDRLKQLGVQGVTITISFPLLNADQPDAGRYLAFYTTVAQHVRARGLALSIEQHVAFSGTAFSNIQFDYSKLPFDQFVVLFREMTRQILDRLQPDFLTLLSEPDTFAKLTGYREALTPEGAAAMVGRVVEGLGRGKTKIGAGAGSWLANAPEYDAAFARLPLDYIDLHIYPVTPAIMETTQRVIEVARAAKKPVVLDEAWLYKTGAGERSDTPFDQPTEAFRRDSFSFWAPLDARFLGLVAQFARANGIAYVAPFWTTFFWGSVAYSDTTKDLPYAQLQQLANQVANQALAVGTFTATGEGYRAAINGR
jgi:hypothetical protein